jgi:hypothetical protein
MGYNVRHDKFEPKCEGYSAGVVERNASVVIEKHISKGQKSAKLRNLYIYISMSTKITSCRYVMLACIIEPDTRYITLKLRSKTDKAFVRYICLSDKKSQKCVCGGRFWPDGVQ